MSAKVLWNNNQASPEMKARKKQVKKAIVKFAATRLNYTFAPNEPQDKYNLYAAYNEAGDIKPFSNSFYFAPHKETFTDEVIEELAAHLTESLPALNIAFTADANSTLRLVFTDFKSHTYGNGWDFTETEDNQEAPVITEVTKPAAPAPAPAAAPIAAAVRPTVALPPLPVTQVAAPAVRKVSRNPFDLLGGK